MNPPTMLAFHGDAAVKRKYLGRIRAHRKADELISGDYWDGRVGCAVGCILHSANHANSEPEMGVPTQLTRLLDRLYERIYKFDEPTAKALPERFVSAPKTGADLSLTFPKFMLWLLLDPKAGVIIKAKREDTRKSVECVGALYRRWAEGDKPSTTEWESARKLAWKADAADAADAAADAAATAATADAAATAATADAAAADAAADAATAFYRQFGYWPSWYYWGDFATRHKKGREHYLLMAEKLISLMGEAVVP